MAQDVRERVASKVAAAGVSIQEILLPFPIAFLIGTLATDVIYALTGLVVWSRISLWLLCVGLVLGVVCVICGLANLAVPRRRHERRVAWIQFPGIELAVLLTVVNVVLRVGDSAAAVSRTGLMLSTMVTTVLVVAGWTGGELTFRRRKEASAVRVAGEASTRMRGSRA